MECYCKNCFINNQQAAIVLLNPARYNIINSVWENETQIFFVYAECLICRLYNDHIILRK